MVRYVEPSHDRRLLRACANRSPVALQELADRYYTDIYRVLHTHLSGYLYSREALEDMTLDCLGKICESTERIIDKFGDLDTAVIGIAAAYARVELRNILRRS